MDAVQDKRSQPVYDHWPDFPPYGDRLELRIRPRWPAQFVLKWLGAGVAYGGGLASVAITVAALIGGGKVSSLGYVIAGGLFLAALPTPLLSEQQYRIQKAEERFAIVKRADHG